MLDIGIIPVLLLHVSVVLSMISCGYMEPTGYAGQFEGASVCWYSNSISTCRLGQKELQFVI